MMDNNESTGNNPKGEGDGEDLTKPNRITFANHKAYINKRVEICIACYFGGFALPEYNYLIGMDEENYYFTDEEGTRWDFKIESSPEDRTTCDVWDYEEYKQYYKRDLP